MKIYRVYILFLIFVLGVKRMERGIPYFGKENNKIWKDILERGVEEHREYKSVLDFVNSECYKKTVVVIDGKWLTWACDAVFNYRDHEAGFYYYEFKLFDIESNRKTDQDGHLILDTENKILKVRYEYELKRLDITPDSVFTLYDVESNKKYTCSLGGIWTTANTFKAESLYSLYLKSCYVKDMYEVLKHEGGFHFLDKKVEKFENVELRVRNMYGLDTQIGKLREIPPYRDVRKFRYEEITKKLNDFYDIELFRYRRLRFESTLYSLMRAGAVAEDIKNWEQLGKTVDYIKYGENIKLIFKSYWLNEFKEPIRKTWSRR